MTERELGRSSLVVSEVGLGCMGTSDSYDPSQINDEESVRVIHRYVDAGGNFLDRADANGPVRNEVLVCKAIAGRQNFARFDTLQAYYSIAGRDLERELMQTNYYTSVAFIRAKASKVEELGV
jgi:aryl-alcohol dehydrogenase-like predicted oxidoreductase